MPKVLIKKEKNKMKQNKLNLITPILLLTFATTCTCYAGQWDGAYTGISLGDRFASSDWKTTEYREPDANGSGTLLPFSSDPHANVNDHNVIWGGYAGYNWQMSDTILLGAEVTMRDGDNSNTVTKLPGTSEIRNPSPYGFSTITAKKNWDTSARARLGFLVTPTIQIYSAAGLSFEQLDLSVDCPKDTNICNPGIGGTGQHNSKSLVQLGWTLGLGTEIAITRNIIARVEYNYADYGRQHFGLPSIDGQSYGMNGNFDSTSHTFSTGLAYKF
jgi:outer membrane immunogenic protein